MRSSAATNILATLAVIAALWWGQRFLVPLTAGLMLVMLVMPLSVWLEHQLRAEHDCALDERTQERRLRPSGALYAAISRANAIPGPP